MLDSLMSGFTREAWYFFSVSFIVLLALIVFVALGILGKLPGGRRGSAEASASRPVRKTRVSGRARDGSRGEGARQAARDDSHSGDEGHAAVVADIVRTTRSTAPRQAAPKKDWAAPSGIPESAVQQRPKDAASDAADTGVEELPDLPLPVRTKQEDTIDATVTGGVEVPILNSVPDEEEIEEEAESGKSNSVFDVFSESAEEDSEMSAFAKNLKNVRIEDLTQEAEEVMMRLKGVKD